MELISLNRRAMHVFLSNEESEKKTDMYEKV